MNYSDLTDRELGECYSQANPQAADELWRRHEPWLRQKAVAYSPRDQHLAEQAMADLEMGNRDAEFQRKFEAGSNASWSSWMHTILRRRIVRALFLELPEWYGLSRQRSLRLLLQAGVPETLRERLEPLIGKRFWNAEAMLDSVDALGLWNYDEQREWQDTLVRAARHIRRTEGVGTADNEDTPEGPATEASPSPADAAARNELLAAFLQYLPDCVDRLGPRVRQLLHGRYLEGMKWAQLAAALFGGGDHNVAYRAHAMALKEIRECLKRHGVRYEN